jgi:hypothetical protein
MSRQLLIIFVLLGLCANTIGQTSSNTVDKNRILIGEPIKLTVKTRVPAAVKNHAFGMDSIPHFEILDSSAVKQTTEGAETVFEKTYTITSWDSGLWTLPSVMSKNSTARPLQIKVEWTQPFDTAQPYHDIKAIVPVGKETAQKWYWYLIGLALLIVLFLLFFPGGKKQAPKPKEPAVDAYRQAIQRLEGLRSKEVDTSNVKQYYSDLVFILRDYLHRRKGIYSHSKTTDDLSIQIKEVKLPTSFHTELLQALRLSDMVKYARYQPYSEENRDTFNTIKQSITEIERGHAV